MGQHVHPLLIESNAVTFPWISLTINSLQGFKCESAGLPFYHFLLGANLLFAILLTLR